MFGWRETNGSTVGAVGALHVATLDAPLHSPLLRWSQPWLVSMRQGVRPLTAKPLPNAASVALCTVLEEGGKARSIWNSRWPQMIPDGFQMNPDD